MTKVLLNIKTDRDVKDQAKKISHELGLPLSVVVNAYLREFVREKSVRIALEPQLRPEVSKILKKASADYIKRKNISRKFSDAADALKYLHS